MKRLVWIICSSLLMTYSSTALAASSWADSDRGLELIQAPEADTILKTQLLTTYALNDWLYLMPLKVKVDKGTVTVKGQVQDELQKQLALKIAWAGSHTQSVIDEIEVNAEVEKLNYQLTFAQKTRDLVTSSKISHKLSSPDIFHGDIKVTTFRNIVTLKGQVATAEQKQRIGRIAEETTGVLEVRNHLEVKPND